MLRAWFQMLLFVLLVSLYTRCPKMLLGLNLVRLGRRWFGRDAMAEVSSFSWVGPGINIYWTLTGEYNSPPTSSAKKERLIHLKYSNSPYGSSVLYSLPESNTHWHHSAIKPKPGEIQTLSWLLLVWDFSCLILLKKRPCNSKKNLVWPINLMLC